MCILNNYVELVSFFCTISLSYICIHYFYAGLLFFIVIRSFLKFTKPQLIQNAVARVLTGMIKRVHSCPILASLQRHPVKSFK